MQWLEVCAKDIFLKYAVLNKEKVFDRNVLHKAFEDSAKGIDELLSRGWDDGGKVKSFKKGVIPMLGYFISHESHHRGNIILTLKQTSERFPMLSNGNYGNGKSKPNFYKAGKFSTQIERTIRKK